MAIKINLLLKKEEKQALKKMKKIIFSGTFLFLANLIIIGSSVYAYWRILKKQVDILEQTVNFYEQQIASLADVEKKKSLLNTRLEEIEEIYRQRVDFVAALEELEKLFFGKLKADSYSLNKTGQVMVVSKEAGIALDPQESLSKDFSTLDLELIASDSAELEDFVNNLKFLKSQGLTRAELASLKRTEEGAYEIRLKLEMKKSEESL